MRHVGNHLWPSVSSSSQWTHLDKMRYQGVSVAVKISEGRHEHVACTFYSWGPGSQLVWHDPKILRHPFFPRPVSLITCSRHVDYTDIRRLTTGIRSEKCVIRRFRCANVIECTYTNLDNITYYTPRLYGIVCCSYATNLSSMLLYWIL
jgi:hypothetical protein